MTYMDNVIRSEQDLGQALKTVRLTMGLTQEQLAKGAGVSRAFVIGLEKGSKPGAELSRVLRVLATLNQHLTIEQNNTIDFNDMLQQLTGKAN